MKKIINLLSITVALFLFTHKISAQGGPPYSIKNSNTTDTYQIRYVIAPVGGTATTFGPYTIIPSGSWTIPVGQFLSSGWITGLTCEIEVQVLRINGNLCTGGLPTTSSTATGGCFTCFPFSLQINSMTWTSGLTTIN